MALWKGIYMKTKIIDSTLRDGEQKVGIAFSSGQKIEIAQTLSELGVDQIEAGTPAMQGEEKKSVRKIAGLGLKAKISAWNRMNIGDFMESMECGVDIIHFSVPVSDIQIEYKLKKDRNWVIDKLLESITFIKENGFTAHVGMEDASRSDIDFLELVCQKSFEAGASMVRYADTVGLASPKKIRESISFLAGKIPINIGFHGHNDLGMALANSLEAASSGAAYVDCTIGGIGERAGNCNFFDFIEQSERYNIKTNIKEECDEIKKAEQKILYLINCKK